MSEKVPDFDRAGGVIQGNWANSAEYKGRIGIIQGISKLFIPFKFVDGKTSGNIRKEVDL